jgi:DNA-binding MarR family transcriptional regulator
MARKTAISSLEEHVGYWMRYVSNHVSHAFATKVEAKGVTVAEWVLLRELYDAEPASPSLLAHKVGMTRGAVSKLVSRLCDKELMVRTFSDQDRRYQTVALTTAGRRLVPELARLADENDQEFFGQLSSAQRRTLLRLLRDMVHDHGWKSLPLD